MRWGGRLGVCSVMKDILPCWSTLGGGTGASSGVSSGVSTLKYGMGGFCCGGTKFGGGCSYGLVAMLKISARCFRDAVCLLPSVVRGLVGVGVIEACVRSADACVTTSSDGILENGRVDGKNYMVSETCSLSVLAI